MTNEKLYELMEKMYAEMQDMKKGIKELKDRQVNLKACLRDLKYGQIRIEKKLDDIEVNNANRHLEMGDQIENLSRDINFVEIVSSKNLADIAYLKSKRIPKIK